MWFTCLVTTTNTDRDTTHLQTVRFFVPADMRGKFHAKRLVTGEADCGAGVLLGDDSVHATKGDLKAGKFHPIICRRCARLNGPDDTSARIVK